MLPKIFFRSVADQETYKLNELDVHVYALCSVSCLPGLVFQFPWLSHPHSLFCALSRLFSGVAGTMLYLLLD